MDKIELIEKRKPREKHFLQKDGTIRAEIYDTDIHYLKDGKYVEIDNTLVKENDSLVNKSNDYKVEFKENFRDSLMKMSKDNHYIDFKLKESKRMNLKSGKRMLSKVMQNITSSDITDDIKIEYQTLSNKVKETIVLQNSNYPELSFDLDTNLKLEEQNGEIISKDEQGNIIFKIEKPFMVDFNGIRNDKIHYLLCIVDEKYVLTLVLDNEWLNDKDRKYPVYIDPTINSGNSELNFYDTFIYPGDTNVDRSNLGYLVAGVDKFNDENRINRALIKFDLPIIGTGYEIVRAILNLYPWSTDKLYLSDKHLVEVRRITSEWNDNNATWDNMNDKYSEKVEFITPVKRGIYDSIIKPEEYPISFDLTGLVKKWYEGTPNYGVMIKSCDETYKDEEYPKFVSNNYNYDGKLRPAFIIIYKNQNGLEKYWDYKSQSFTDGYGYVNTHTGNLTTVFNVGKTIGGVMPATLSLIYNTNDVVLGNQTFFGKGYKLNLEQVIEKIDNSFQYLDEDGTIHYFYKKDGDSDTNNLYYDEDGLGLTIEELDTELKMIDTNNTEMIFAKKDDKYYLTLIKDSDGNTVSVNYNSDNSINKIIDKYNQEIIIQYDTNNIQIISSDNKVVKLNYFEGKLSSIESIYGITNILYDENNVISTIEDVTGQKCKYEYYDNIPYRIKKINNIGSNNAKGKSLTFEYSIYETTVIDDKGMEEIIAYNDYGNAESRNFLERKNKVIGAYSLEKIFGIKNKIRSEMIAYKYINNYLKNTSFEDESVYFSIEPGIMTSYDTYNINSGLRSLKVESDSPHKSIRQSVFVPKGRYYTFSGYIKNSNAAKIILSYTNSDNQEIRNYDKIDVSNEFERQDVTLFYGEDAISDLNIVIELDEIGVLYLDDIQLEEGEVANYYNIIENSNFKDGLSGWDYSATKNGVEVEASDYINIVAINNETRALKIAMEYNLGTSVERKFNIKGKAGDAYTLSFWYKNKATLPYAPYVGSNVSIFYEPYNADFGHCILSRMLPITNGDSWQHFVYTEKSVEDFKSIKLIFHNNNSANDFIVTNISFYKDVTQEEYCYDGNDNLVSIVDQFNNESNLEYDQKEQLITITNTKGKSLKYEYDVNNKNRIINSVLSSGLVSSNKYKNGNIVKNKISKKLVNDIIDGIYKIRRKGTFKYIKAELNMVLLEESDCSNTIWFFEKHEDKFKIIYNTNKAYSISYRSGQIVLDDVDNNNLFYLEKNDDNSYNLKYDDVKDEKTTVRFLSAMENDSLELNPYDDASNIDFYVEMVENEFIESDTHYTEDEKFKNNQIDSIFRKTTFENNVLTGNIKKITNPKGITTEYKYNSKNQCTNVKYANLEVNYVYGNQNQLSNIIQGNKNYSINYNDFMKVSSIALNNNILSSNEYEPNDGPIKKIIYGNNQAVEIKYDEFNRISMLIKEDDTYNYFYDTNGNVSKVKSNDSLTKVTYDKNNRMHSYSIDDFKVKYLYDSENLITDKEYKYNNCTNTQKNSFDDEKLVSTELDNIIINYSYDSINRNVGKNINNIVNTSVDFISSGKRTSNIINRFQVNNDIYKYEYDELLSTKKVYLNNNLIKEYEYDDYNQLLKEKNYDLDIEISYIYDGSGNILKKISKCISSEEVIETKDYTYNNSNWEDQLTSYNNSLISYDNLGNMVSFNNDNYYWKNGIELACITNNYEGKIINYKYDTNGIRCLKVCNGIVTKYFALGDEIIYEDRNGTVIYYLYDVDGLIGFKYNDEIYYYLKNLQNDIIGILDENGNKVAFYIYDSWGKILYIKDENGNEISSNQSHIANINPFRYRSYYYDVDTKLYYLNHRYYNPEIGRFISPDVVLGSNGDVLSYNLYAYVSNNPISNYDRTGNGSFLNNIFSTVANFFSKKPAKNSNKNTTKKNNKSTCIGGICFPSSVPSGPVSVTGDISINSKSTVSNGSKTTTQYINGSGISYDVNYGSYGYDLYGPGAGDIYASKTLEDFTYKGTFGIDGKYLYYGIDMEYNITDNLSVSGYLRINVDTNLIKAVSYSAVTITVFALAGSAIAATASAAAPILASAAAVGATSAFLFMLS